MHQSDKKLERVWHFRKYVYLLFCWDEKIDSILLSALTRHNWKQRETNKTKETKSANREPLKLTLGLQAKPAVYLARAWHKMIS